MDYIHRWDDVRQFLWTLNSVFSISTSSIHSCEFAVSHVSPQDAERQSRFIMLSLISISVPLGLDLETKTSVTETNVPEKWDYQSLFLCLWVWAAEVSARVNKPYLLCWYLQPLDSTQINPPWPQSSSETAFTWLECLDAAQQASGCKPKEGGDGPIGEVNTYENVLTQVSIIQTALTSCDPKTWSSSDNTSLVFIQWMHKGLGSMISVSMITKSRDIKKIKNLVLFALLLVSYNHLKTKVILFSRKVYTWVLVYRPWHSKKEKYCWLAYINIRISIRN